MTKIVSFGYKSRLPPKADLVFDARALPNPHKAFPRSTGLDPCVQLWLARHHTYNRALLGLYHEALGLSIRNPQATIAIGCHGGKHRSVALAHQLGHLLGAEVHHLELQNTSSASHEVYHG